jgi:hypothetical protein
VDTTPKTFLSGAALLAVIPSFPDLAVNVPVKAAFPSPQPGTRWSGFQIGVANAGLAWKQDDGRLQCVDRTEASFRLGCRPRVRSRNSPGSCGGGQIGKYALGFETDFKGPNIRGSTNANGPGPFVGSPHLSPTLSLFATTQNVEWFGTAPLPLGYVSFDRTLICATGRSARTLAHDDQAETPQAATPALNSCHGDQACRLQGSRVQSLCKVLSTEKHRSSPELVCPNAVRKSRHREPGPKQPKQKMADLAHPRRTDRSHRMKMALLLDLTRRADFMMP